MKNITSFLTRFLDNLFEGLDAKSRWASLMGILFIVFIIILCVEHFSGWNYYNQLEEKTEILNSLNNLAEKDIISNLYLKPIYLDIVEELSLREIKPITIKSIDFNKIDFTAFWKGFFFSIIWLTVSIMILFGAVEIDNRVVAGTVAFLIAIIFGFIGSIIPTIYNPWINNIGFPILQFLIISRLGKLSSKKKN